MLVTFVALVSLARALELGNMKRDSWIVDCQILCLGTNLKGKASS